MQSIKRHVFGSVIFITLFVLISFPLFVYFGLSRSLEEIVIERNKMISSEVATRIELFIDSRIAAIKRLGQSSEWLISQEREKPLLDKGKRFFTNDSNLVYFLVMDKKGKTFFEWSIDEFEAFERTPSSFSFKPEIGDVLFHTLVSPKTGKTYLSESLQTENLQLYAVVKLDTLVSFSDKGLFSDRNSILILDEEGAVVSSADWESPPPYGKKSIPLYTMKKQRNEIIIEDYKGKEFWADFQTLSSTKWTVIVAEPLSEINNLIRPVLVFATVLALVIVLGSFFVLIIESVYILRGVKAFHKAIIQYTKGDYVSILPSPKFEELEPVGDAFYEMGQAIASREKSLEQKNHEKEVLLRELHHRVKNNLQIITSLLSLQEPYLVDDKDKFFYRKTRARVSAMARVHESLYISSDPTKIDMKAYINDLFPLVCNIMESPDIAHSVSGDDFFLAIDNAIPLSLVVFELISTTVFGIFNENDEKTFFEINCKKLLDGNFSIVLKTNGPSLTELQENSKENFPLSGESAFSLGISLVNILLDQISAKYTMTKDKQYTLYNIWIPQK